MELRFIDDGTKLDIEVLSHDSVSDKNESFKGTFCGMDRVISFFVSCDELFKRFQEFNANNYLRISFYRGAEVYIFTAKLTDTLNKKGKNLITLTASSPLERTSLRKTTRVEIALPVDLFEVEPTAPNMLGNLVCKGRTLDMSSEGICFLSNKEIDAQCGAHYILELSFPHLDTFFLPVKLMRKGDCPQSVQFKYDYGFSFEFSEDSEEKSNLMISMYKYKMG